MSGSWLIRDLTVAGLHAADDATAGESVRRDPGQGVPRHCWGDPQPAGHAARMLSETGKYHVSQCHTAGPSNTWSFTHDLFAALWLVPAHRLVAYVECSTWVLCSTWRVLLEFYICLLVFYLQTCEVRGARLSSTCVLLVDWWCMWSETVIYLRSTCRRVMFVEWDCHLLAFYL